jgi:hypothetical protein
MQATRTISSHLFLLLLLLHREGEMWIKVGCIGQKRGIYGSRVARLVYIY